jgi:hypothetical protein
MNLYHIYAVAEKFDRSGGSAMVVVAAESEQDARETRITHYDKCDRKLEAPRYVCDLIGTTSIPAGVVCVDHDYDYLHSTCYPRPLGK